MTLPDPRLEELRLAMALSEDQMRAKLRNWCKERGTHAQAAVAMKISRTLMEAYLSGKRPISADVAKELGYELRRIITRRYISRHKVVDTPGEQA